MICRNLILLVVCLFLLSGCLHFNKTFVKQNNAAYTQAALSKPQKKPSDPTVCDFDPNDPAVGCWITRHKGYPTHVRWVLNLKKDNTWFYDKLGNLAAGRYRVGGIEYAYGLPDNPDWARQYPEPYFSLYNNVGLPPAWGRGYEITWNAPVFYEDFSIMDLRAHRSETDYFVLDGGRHYAMTLLRLNTTKLTADILDHDSTSGTYQVITPVGYTFTEITNGTTNFLNSSTDFAKSYINFLGKVYKNATYHNKMVLRSHGLAADDIINVTETLITIYLGGKTTSFISNRLFQLRSLMPPNINYRLGDIFGWYTKNNKNTFPKNTNNLFPGLPRDQKGRIYLSDKVRIRPEQHPLKPGETYSRRHHSQHYHVDIRKDPTKSWNNKNNIVKIKPPAYKQGHGTGFLPGEKFPGAK